MNLKKALLWTDSHLGKKNNNSVHLNDCMEYVQWLVSKIKEDSAIDHIIFLGDFFDKRDAVAITTLTIAYDVLTLLNSLNLKIFHVIGNHELANRNNRDLYSSVFFQKFNNIELITEPTEKIINGKTVLFLPYLFPEEYISLSAKINNAAVVFGHLELKGFVMTGQSITLDHGPDPDDFKGPKRIFSGHFHKRQQKNNITYIGNTFPMDFSDANDTERGFATYEYSTDKLEFFNYKNGPSYVRAKLSDLLVNHKTILKPKAVVRCLVDTDISLEESIEIKEMLMKKYSLREFTLEETQEDISLTEDIEIDEKETTENIIRNLLEKIVVEKLDKTKLIKEYDDLHI